MKIEEIFEKNEYIEIKDKQEIQDISEGEDLRLNKIYIHKSQREMFIVLDSIGLNKEEILDIIESWEKNIVDFVNFGENFRANIEFLKYNFYLLIICSDKGVNYDVSEFEKSSRICRKIFISVDEECNIKNQDELLIPYYLDNSEFTKNEDSLKEKEELIKNNMPDKKELYFVYERKEIVDDVMLGKIDGWLKNDKN